jgi:cerevisin
MVGLFSIISLAVVVAATPLSASHSTLQRHSTHGLAPLTTPDPAATVVKDGYIVVLKDGVSTEQLFAHIDGVNAHSDSLMQKDGGLKHVYNLGGFKGYAGSFEQDTLDILRAQPEVDYIEKDTIVHAIDTQYGAPWVSTPYSCWT